MSDKEKIFSNPIIPTASTNIGIKLFRKQLNEKYDVYSKLDFIHSNGSFLAACLNMYYYNREKEEDFLYSTLHIFDWMSLSIKDSVERVGNHILSEIKDHYDREEYSVERVEAYIKSTKERNKGYKYKYVR